MFKNKFYICKRISRPMKNLFILFFVFFLFTVFQVKGQYFYEHELSANVGIYQMRSDYGIRNDNETNFGNQGVAFSISYLYNPAYRNRKSFFQAHFKYRFNLQYSSSDLQHYGDFLNEPQLAAMTGSYTNLSINNGLEYYPLKIKTYKKRSYQSFLYDLNPYLGFGLGLNFVKPEAESSLPGGLNNPANIWPTFISDGPESGINTDNDTVLSFNFRLGLRYKLNMRSEILLESSWRFFNSDLVDGLSPVGPQNKFKDWSWGINVGYSYLIF